MWTHAYQILMDTRGTQGLVKNAHLDSFILWQGPRFCICKFTGDADAADPDAHLRIKVAADLSKRSKMMSSI